MHLAISTLCTIATHRLFLVVCECVCRHACAIRIKIRHYVVAVPAKPNEFFNLPFHKADTQSYCNVERNKKSRKKKRKKKVI